jgi:FkbM family methyltransferase
MITMRRRIWLGKVAKVNRNGFNWELDLSEGIDFSLWVTGIFERTTLEAYSAWIRDGAVVLDVGANIGAHTLPLARLAGASGKVFAFEPTIFAYEKLKKNISLNQQLAKRITCIQAMLTDSEGLNEAPTRLYASWPLTQESELHRLHGGKLKEIGTARVTTLDQLLDELEVGKIDFIKVDIDGYESRMFRGAENTLKRWKPIILMELAPYVLKEASTSAEELIKIVANYGYSFYLLDGKTQLFSRSKTIDELVPIGASINILAIPK